MGTVDRMEGWQYKLGVLKGYKESYPVEVAKFALATRISMEPAFAWGVPFVLKKRNRILAKVKSKYWLRTHKLGIRIPKSVKEAKKIDEQNGDTLWWGAICMEMRNVLPAFEVFEGKEENIPKDYQFMRCHMIFDIKFGENFWRKGRLVAEGHMTDTPNTLTYSSVVSRDSVHIALTIVTLNELSVMACDIQNFLFDCRVQGKDLDMSWPRIRLRKWFCYDSKESIIWS